MVLAANLEVTGRARIWEYLARGQEPSYVGVTWTQRRDLQREGIREVVFVSSSVSRQVTIEQHGRTQNLLQRREKD